MRTISQFERDTYLLNLLKEVCVFTMIVYGLFNETMMTTIGPMIALMAVVFMFIPRVIINDLLDKEAKGTREIKPIVVPEWKRTLNVVLNITKFICLIILVLYIFLNKEMMDFGGILLIWMVSVFMIIPRKLINMWAKDAYGYV